MARWLSSAGCCRLRGTGLPVAVGGAVTSCGRGGETLGRGNFVTAHAAPSTFTRALVVGKFLPPHLGHSALIDHALTVAAAATVMVCDIAGQLPVAGDRASWLQAQHPMADIVIVADICPHPSTAPCPPECSPAWANRLAQLGLVSDVDCVVSSEGYGDLLAAALGVAHVSFDPGRVAISVSGIAVRADLAGNWALLPQATRVGLHRRVVVLGAESTGTTTLARDVATALCAPLTHEEGRAYSWRLAAGAAEPDADDDVVWTQQDFWRIVLRQRQAEALAASTAAAPGHCGPWLVCDTDALATVAWWERYLPAEPVGALSAAAHATLAELYIVTSPDGVPFEDDGMRDGEHLRHRMHARFLELVESSGRPYVVVDGDRPNRAAAALAAIEHYESANPRFIV